MTRVLVAEDSRTQAVQIRYYLEKAGLEVEVAADGLKALSAIEARMPDVVLTDLQMPEMDGLQLVEAVRSKYPALPVLLMTGPGSEDFAVAALRKGAVSYIPKSELQDGIGRTLRNVLIAAKAVQDHPTLRRCLDQADFQFQIENDAALVPPLVAYLEEELIHVNLCDRTGVVQVAIALTEALDNAIYRGNLELGSDLREDSKAFCKLADERRAQSPYQDRRVRLRATIEPDEAVFVVTDEGPGFDLSILPDPTDFSNLTHLGGRGLLLMKNFLDEVKFNDRGNEVTLVKRRQAG